MLGADIFVVMGSRNRLADNASYTLQPEVSSPPGGGVSAMAQNTTDGHHNLESESALGQFSKRKHVLKTLNKVNNKYI